jgi:4,5-DOPA dioxygenase extradiol
MGLAGAILTGGSLMNESVEAAAGLKSLAKSPRMPVLFLGHGSPMNAIQDNEYRRSWQSLGAEFGKSLPRPQLVLCISAHWLTRGWWLTGMAQPKTIHDFGGFPQELFDQQFPAPGAPEVAQQIAQGIRQPEVGLDKSEWGFDHGTWSVLKPMFPQADIPVIQLSMDYARPPAEHFALGQQLKGLRERGVLIVGSGNIVHNLRATRREASAIQAYDWAIEFDNRIAAQLQKGDLAGLAEFQKLGQVAQLAHPTYDHYLPLLHAAGAVDAKEPVRFFNANYQSASISMRSVVWG